MKPARKLRPSGIRRRHGAMDDTTIQQEAAQRRPGRGQERRRASPPSSGRRSIDRTAVKATSGEGEGKGWERPGGNRMPRGTTRQGEADRAATCTRGVPIGAIPACTGEPGGGSRFQSMTTVYPRVYGGTARRATLGASAVGLSPRVRGNPSVSRRVLNRHRSIPACTGEPLRLISRTASRKVYPRVYGGTGELLASITSREGLSPRVRGNPPYSPRLGARRGSIPACTGEPHPWTCDSTSDRSIPACTGEP